MASTETKVQTAVQLYEQVRSYLMLEKKYLTLETSERISRILSYLLLALILLGVGMLVFALLMITIVHILADITGNTTLSYGIVTLVVLLVALIIWFSRNALIVRPISNFIDSVLNPSTDSSFETNEIDSSGRTIVELLPNTKEELKLTIKLRQHDIKDSIDRLTSNEMSDDPTVGERVGAMIDKSMSVYRGATFALGLFNIFKSKKSNTPKQANNK